MNVDAATIIAWVNSAAAFLEGVIPKIKEAVQSGDITVDQQQQLEARLNNLRVHSSFSGPEWDQSNRADQVQRGPATSNQITAETSIPGQPAQPPPATQAKSQRR